MLDTIIKLNAACHQLDSAMRLLMDDGDVVCAITLAGAAEEVLGKSLGADAAAKEMEAELGKQFGTDVMNRMNETRNWLKHFDSRRGLLDQHETDWLQNAVQLLCRALANVNRLRQRGQFINFLPNESRFAEYVEVHKERLLEDYHR